MTDNPWQFWQDALDGEKPQMSPDSPEWGYYKTRQEKGPWEPVQIWQDEKGWIAHRSGEEVRNFKRKDGKEVITGKVDELWNWCGRFPITQEEFEERTAGTFSGDDPTVSAALTGGPPLNSEGVTEAEMLRDQIDAAVAGAKAYVKVTSDEQAGKAQSLRARLNELHGIADKRREALKKPHFEAGKAVDAEWMPLVKDAKETAAAIKKAIDTFATEQLRVQREQEAELAQFRRAAEQEARQKAEKAGRPDLVETFIEAAVPSPAAPETTIKGTYGRAATKVVEFYVAEITDQDALYAYFRGFEEVKLALLNLAQKSIKAGLQVPGVRIEERVTVR